MHAVLCCAVPSRLQILLAISTTASATGTWILYSFDGEVTSNTPMQCDGYPVSLQSQVTYNRDGVYVSWVQNCPPNQELDTGAVLMALPKWAVYKGATWFYAPVWTAWDIYDSINLDSEAYYPGAFLQLQPVMPQRAEDVQAEVVYFVMDVSAAAAPPGLHESCVCMCVYDGKQRHAVHGNNA